MIVEPPPSTVIPIERVNAAVEPAIVGLPETPFPLVTLIPLPAVIVLPVKVSTAV